MAARPEPGRSGQRGGQRGKQEPGHGGPGRPGGVRTFPTKYLRELWRVLTRCSAHGESRITNINNKNKNVMVIIICYFLPDF